jgi:hypothetical protein
MNIVGLNRSSQGIVIGIGRIGARIYMLELRKIMRETLSDIYCRIHFRYVTVSSVYQSQAKLQCRWV